ncbi:unnamed protein product [Trypanosoma congolense IL3000]|uniref:WGS project CAEQ00000000 data, annotated contig 350 n=1 Tax=Trypanosoma congolense (strain IL3000) TaxID=1068625 RepID=F9WF48_TRYCI|nr:unnamed protein product [Trypanosoma congolense IL3000]
MPLARVLAHHPVLGKALLDGWCVAVGFSRFPSGSAAAVEVLRALSKSQGTEDGALLVLESVGDRSAPELREDVEKNDVTVFYPSTGQPGVRERNWSMFPAVQSCRRSFSASPPRPGSPTRALAGFLCSKSVHFGGHEYKTRESDGRYGKRAAWKPRTKEPSRLGR